MVLLKCNESYQTSKLCVPQATNGWLFVLEKFYTLKWIKTNQEKVMWKERISISFCSKILSSKIFYNDEWLVKGQTLRKTAVCKL